MDPSQSLPAIARILPPAPRAGYGRIAAECAAGRTYLTRLVGRSPLKLLTPRKRSPTAWVIASNYGGGLLAGDELRLTVDAGPGARLFLGTQASTKVYRSPDGRPARQELSLTAADGAVCVIAPDPVTPYAGASYDQRQRLHLSAGASLVLLDWLTSGRTARGERWAFARYRTRTDVLVAGRPVLRDALLLDAADGNLDAPCRTGGFDCLATAVLLGPAVAPRAAALAHDLNRLPMKRDPITFSASPLPNGAILRIAGPGPEPVARWLRNQLAFVTELLGDDPWARKW